MTEIHFIGRACRLPKANTVKELTEILYGNRCVVTEIPEDRWSHRRYLHPVAGTLGKSYSFSAGVLDDIWGFDPGAFNISPREAGQMDPQQRILLQVVWEAIEDSGIIPSELAGKNVGVYVGTSALDYSSRLAHDGSVTGAYMMTGNTLSLVANRISHAFDLRGPSMTVDTACSSSLVALNEAEKAIYSGEIDYAIVAGVNILLTPTPFIGFSAARMLSPVGRCQPFSANADGYVRAEGAVAFVLQKSDLSELAPSRSYGRLAGVETNTDGKTINVALPSPVGQLALLEHVYDRAGVDPRDLIFVEAHGTGTLVGDPVEAEALGKALGQNRTTPLPIGSIKSNIGHLEPASGVAGLLKTLIALEENRLPASLHAEKTNPAIPFEDLNLQLANTNIELPEQKGNRFAGISSFGFGGANAHAIIEAPKPQTSMPAPAPEVWENDKIFFTSAFCQEALKAKVKQYQPLLVEDALGDTCKQSLHFRGTYPQRLALICNSDEETREALENYLTPQRDPRVFSARSPVVDAPPVFLFSGNGAQYAGMSLATLSADGAYAATYRELDKKFAEIAGWSLIEMLNSETLDEELAKSEVAQPLLFADQVSLTRALAARGLKPAAVLGHSGGEVAAACCSGALDLDQGLALIHRRGKSQMQLSGRGAMAALQVSDEKAREALAEIPETEISIAAVNSPRSVTLVGPEDEISDFIQFAKRKKRWACVKLPISYPYHGQAQEEIKDELLEALAFVAPSESLVPFLSTVRGEEVAGTSLTADYWWSNVRRPVKYQDTITAAREMGFKAFLEIGPQPVLASYTNDSLGDDSIFCSVTHSFEKPDCPEVNPVSRTVSRALVHGCRISKEKIAPRPEHYSGNLPIYPWQNTEYRADSTDLINRHLSVNETAHPLLGLEFNAKSSVWLSDIDTELVPELADHRVGGNALVPGSYFAELAIAATQRTLDQDAVELRDLDIMLPLPLAKGVLNEIRVQIAKPHASLKISSRPKYGGEEWRDHVSCRSYKANGEAQQNPAPSTDWLPGDRDGRLVYEMAAQIGLNYGPSFQRVTHFRMTGDSNIEVVLSPAEGLKDEDRKIALDPVAADAVFHGLVPYLAELTGGHERLGYVPVHVSRLQLFTSGATIRSGRITVQRVGKKSVVADFSCYDDDGQEVARLSAVRFRAVKLVKDVSLDTHGFGFHLHPVAQFDVEPVGIPNVQAKSLARAFEEIAQKEEFEPEDETVFLLEAAAQRIAYDVIAGFADDQGTVKLPDQAGDEASRTYFFNLLNILATLDLAWQDEAVWKIDSNCDLPEVELLLSGLLDERPELVPEYAVLTRLRNALPGLLDGSLEWNAQSVFGRDALENFRSGSVYANRRADLLTRGLMASIAELEPQRLCRIGELIKDAPKVLPELMRLTNRPGIEFLQIHADMNAASGIKYDGGTDGQVMPVIPPTGEMLAENGPFDLLVIPGLMHIVASAEGPLAELRKSLSDDGVLVVLENTPSDFLDMVYGVNPDWFGNTQDPELPIGQQLSAAEMGQVLDNSGFEPQSPVVLPDGFGGSTVLVATAPVVTASEDQSEQDPTQKLSRPEHSNVTDLTDLIRSLVVGADFSESGSDRIKFDAATGISTLAARPSVEKDGSAWPTVYCVHEYTSRASKQELLENRILFLAKVLAAHEGSNAPLWMVIPKGAGYAGDCPQIPAQAAIWAFMRTAKNEHPGIEIKCVDQMPGLMNEAFAQGIATLLRDGTDETEIAISEGHYSALRVKQGIARPQATLGSAKNAKSILSIGPVARLDDLSWAGSDRKKPESDEIEIEIAATGLNYRDVMWAMGILPEEALESGFAGPTLGIECAGTVVRVGSDVGAFSVGDRVMTFGPSCFSSHMTVKAMWAGKLPKDVDLAAAATVPVAFFTAYYALSHLARLEQDETVLIHGGAGGVGLAAIQIAQGCGARVIATAGSDLKRDFLRSLGVDHVLNSRNLKFHDDVMELTDGEGVDVVLNSLSGEAMELSLNCLSRFGRFLELGKQDYYANTSIGLRPLKENISYYGVDVDQLLAVKPALAKRLNTEMMDLFRSGALSPLPFRAFKGNQIVEAFRLMQRSGHIGKLVVSPEPASAAAIAPAQQVFRADAEGIHVIIGGLGGFGLDAMDWLARSGARKIALISRSGEPNQEANARILRLDELGLDVFTIACDVADKDALADVLADLRKKGPIKGIIHSAMVLDDMLISALDREALTKTMSAKVAGTENLDLLTRQDDLEYFVLFSSIATLIGNHGQAAYVAANSFMEGLVRCRRAAGLPGLAVGWGAITDVGYLARDKEKAEVVNRFSGNVEFTGTQALHALEVLLAGGETNHPDPVVYVTPMRWTATATALKVLSGPSYKQVWMLGQNTEDQEGFDDLREKIMQLSPEEAEENLEVFLSQKIAQILRIPENSITPTQPVAELGMDSLMGVELGLSMQQSLGDDLPMTTISETLSIRDIAKKIVAHVKTPSTEGGTGDAILDNLAAQHRVAIDDPTSDTGTATGNDPNEGAVSTEVAE